MTENQSLNTTRHIKSNQEPTFKTVIRQSIHTHSLNCEAFQRYFERGAEKCNKLKFNSKTNKVQLQL